jgi:hypothetical protein
VKFLADARLYSCTESCLRFLRDVGRGSGWVPPPVRERFHLYWRGTFGLKQAFCVKSFLATQDLANCELWLWLDAYDGYEGYLENELLRPLLPFLQVQRFDPEVEARGTPLERRSDLWRGKKSPGLSDLLRHVVLYKHGGTYADMDMMFLRDMRELFGDSRVRREFCYAWSVGRPHANSAILRLRQGSEVARTLLLRADECKSCHPSDLLRIAENRDLDLLVLPCPFFDPLWPHRDRKARYAAAPFDRFEDFFRPLGWRYRRKAGIRSYRNFFPGAFTYHWHNCWDAPELRDSYFGLFNREFDGILQDRLGVGPAPAQHSLNGGNERTLPRGLKPS